MAWEGDFEELHSLAIVNRAICRGLGERGHEVRRIQDAMGSTEAGFGSFGAGARAASLAAADGTAGAREVGADAALGVSAACRGPGCPCSARSTRSGRTAATSATATSTPACRPSGSTSSRWASIRRSSARAWSRWHCRQGLDFGSCSSAERSSARGSTCCWRPSPGPFRPGDGIGLVIKDMGSQSFYRGQTAEAEVAGLRERGYPVEYIDRDLERGRAGRALRRLRLPGAPVPGRGLRPAGGRGHGLRPAGDRHRGRAGARLCHGRDGVPHPRPSRAVRRVPRGRPRDRSTGPGCSSRTPMPWSSC